MNGCMKSFVFKTFWRGFEVGLGVGLGLGLGMVSGLGTGLVLGLRVGWVSCIYSPTILELKLRSGG